MVYKLHKSLYGVNSTQLLEQILTYRHPLRWFQREVRIFFKKVENFSNNDLSRKMVPGEHLIFFKEKIFKNELVQS